MGEQIARALKDTELAALLGVSQRTVQNWRKAGDAPASIKVGQTRRTPRSSFIRWAVEHGHQVEEKANAVA